MAQGPGPNPSPSSSSSSSSSSPLSSSSFNDYHSKLQTTALKATRTAAALPSDINFYRSLDNAVAQNIDNISSRALALTNRLLEFSVSVGGISGGEEKVRGKGKGKGKTRLLEDKDDVVDDFHSLVVDVMDQLFERTDSCLDQVLGRNKTPAIAINRTAVTNVSQKRKVITSKGALDSSIHHATYLAKPQLKFKRKPDNSDTPWYPSLSHKYNAKVPLGHVYTNADEDVNMDGGSKLVANHPYRYEINHITYPQHVYTSTSSPTPPSTLSSTTPTWISTPTALHSLLEKLRSSTEFAVDLEHHSYRSYLGFLCLMQISIRSEDFIIDCIELRGEMECLNEVFTDENIVKVFHGAESDVVWLQQDFGIYVVNLFDTFHASKLLDFPRHGLANLLEMYCDYTPDKRYQLADWRIRPLPDELLEYARADTHFLLFIYDNLRNALIDRATSRSRSSSPPTTTTSNTTTNTNAPVICTPPSTSKASTNPAHRLINHVLARSSETCLRVFSKEAYDHLHGSGPTGWDTLAKKWNKPFFTASFNPPVTTPQPSSSNVQTGSQIQTMQKEVYKSIHWWREKVAREEDESTRYILPNQYLFRIAESPPADLSALLRVLGGHVSSVVKAKAKELLDVITECVKKALGKDEGMKKGENVVDGQKDETMVGTREEVKQPEVGQTANVARSVRESDKLWGSEKTNEMIQTSSSLFGKNAQTPTSAPSSDASKSNSYTLARSSLFGDLVNTKRSQPLASADISISGSSRFQDLVKRINSTLVIAPTVPKVQTKESTTMATTEAVLEDATGMQIEIPFVPAAQRQTTATQVVEEKEKDTIIVAGQTSKTKKRKRTKNTFAKKPEGTPEGDAEEKAAFDFASVPNILDDNPDTGEGEGVGGGTRKPIKKKQKKSKGGQFFGDFPAPPKAYSEFKGGNQSHTFK
ncbi:Exosome complex exonuclease rrp6 [Leucoagaricus sp. SymC.cos]|nr:Exosome complex exonuclease rrp6 [Leucoagaricus sp. SymC.cos]